MRLDATRFLPVRLIPALFAVMLMLAGGHADAQINPTWDHYKLYIPLSPSTGQLITINEQVTLADQFGVATGRAQNLQSFAVPCEKIHGAVAYPINRPELHYTWWTFTEQAPTLDVVVNNQFGEQTIHIAPLGQGDYLLSPALKNAPVGTTLPIANHYHCYECTGNPINVVVTLTDQFGTRIATVAQPRWFCNPAEKRLLDGTVYPIVDPKQHYVVYDTDFLQASFPATIRDQFILDTPVNLVVDRILMVPSDKLRPVPTGPNTWGKLKTLYR